MNLDGDSEEFKLGQVWQNTQTLAKAVSRIEEQLGQLREDVAGLKVVARVWGAVAGIVGGGIVTIIALILKAVVGK